MSLEQLALAVLALIILCFVNRKAIPAEFQGLGWAVIVLGGALWVWRHATALLHCCH